MTTYQILVDVLERITNAYSDEVESLAECCSSGGTGFYGDMNEEDAEDVRARRALVAEAEAVIESLNLDTSLASDRFDFSSIRAKGEELRVFHHNV